MFFRIGCLRLFCARFSALLEARPHTCLTDALLARQSKNMKGRGRAWLNDIARERSFINFY